MNDAIERVSRAVEPRSRMATRPKLLLSCAAEAAGPDWRFEFRASGAAEYRGASAQATASFAWLVRAGLVCWSRSRWQLVKSQ